jgi:hypothetical protein
VGILDETHLRFFTLASSKRIANDSGLDVLSTSVTSDTASVNPAGNQQRSNLKLSPHYELGFGQAQKDAVRIPIYPGMPTESVSELLLCATSVFSVPLW